MDISKGNTEGKMKAVLCPVCNGSGKLVDQSPGITTTLSDKLCHGCAGKGWVEVHESITPLPFYLSHFGPNGVVLVWRESA